MGKVGWRREPGRRGDEQGNGGAVRQLWQRLLPRKTVD